MLMISNIKSTKSFEGNKEVTPESLKLKQLDSIAVTASYSFPVAYDTLVISKSNLKRGNLQRNKNLKSISLMDSQLKLAFR